MKGHNNPRCLKWGERRAPLEARIRRVYSAVKRLGEKSELSTAVNCCNMYLFVTAMQEGRLIVLAQVSDFGNGCPK